MPIYEYRCSNGHVFDVIQSMSDDPVESCEQCGAPVERVFHPVAVHFKGSGFYSTDYKGKVGAESAKEDGKPDSSSDSKAEKKGDSKKESKASSSEGSGD